MVRARRSGAGAIGVAVVMLGLAPIHAQGRGDDGFLASLARAVRTRLDDAAAAHVVKLVPPVPVTLKWKLQKLGSLPDSGRLG